MRKMQASTLGVAAAIVAAHVVVLGVLALVQGCGTTRGPVALPNETPMPPALVPMTPLRPDPVTPRPAPVATAPMVAPVQAVPPVTPATPAETSVYVVGKGDHLSGIAKQLGVSVKEIMALNNLRDANKIYSGQRLTVPGKVDQGALPVRPVVSPPPGGAADTYVVRSGDSLSVIAQRYGVSTADLVALNGLKGDLIRVGQKLAIPTGGKKPVDVEPRREPAGRSRDDLPQPVLPVTAPETTGAGIGGLPTDLAPVIDAPVSGARKHKVRAGDTLLSVASQWNVSIADLKRANDIPDGPLTPGQMLAIPVSD